MNINYDKEKLSSALKNFSTATGININLLHENFTPIFRWRDYQSYHGNIPVYCNQIQSTPEGCDKCRCSDYELLKKCKESMRAEYHVCHAGLVDVAVPIADGDKILAYLILGQMKKERDFSKVYTLISKLKIPYEKMEKSYNSIPLYDDIKISSVINVAVMLTKYILLENMLNAKNEKNTERMTKYIESHLSEPLSPDSISEGIYLSKTTLYKLSHLNFGVSLGEYINMRRTEMAASLLLTTDLSIEEIALKTGFSGASYFGKVFKKQKGVTPMYFRKTQR